MFWEKTFKPNSMLARVTSNTFITWHFLKHSKCFPCIHSTYGRCPLIQPDWLCIAGRKAIACEQEFGFGLSCFMREIPNPKVCLTGPHHNVTWQCIPGKRLLALEEEFNERVPNKIICSRETQMMWHTLSWLRWWKRYNVFAVYGFL